MEVEEKAISLFLQENNGQRTGKLIVSNLIRSAR
jgi:hypothetical protein